MAEVDVELVLIEWGKWSRGGYGGGGAANLWVNEQRRGFAPDISDEMALRVDSAVVACGVEKPVLRHVLQMYYQETIGVVDIQLRLRVGRRVVDKYLAEAKGFVSGYLSGHKEAA